MKFENALHELERYLTDLRGIFQTVVRHSSGTWLEVKQPLLIILSTFEHLGSISRSKSFYIKTC